jgi:prevent-host-death family protein
MAIVVAISITAQMPLAEVRNKLSEVVDNVEREHDRVVITRHGRPAAVVLSVDDLESLEETLEVLSNSVEITAIEHRSDAYRPRG